MLEAALEGKRELFDGLYLGKSDYDFHPYPLLHLDMSRVTATEGIETFKSSLTDYIWSCVRKYDLPIERYMYSPVELFNAAINELAEKTGEEVCVLIDEYDTILTRSLTNRDGEEIRAVTRGLYSKLKPNSDNIHFLFITGITRFSNQSLFSKLNNMRDLTFSSAFSSAFGYTQAELEAYFEGVWNLDVCKPFHDNEKLAEKKKVKEERELLTERYHNLKAEYPELFDGSWDYEAHTYEAGRISLLSNPTHIYGKEPVLFYELIQLMSQAEERVIFQSPYVVCNSWMYEELAGLAKKVPDTRILLNSVENGDNFVASSDYLRHKDEVVATGIQLYEYDGGTSNHGKSVLIDQDLSAVGSYNLDLRSTYLDTELMLVVQSEELNQELEGYLTAMQESSRKVIDADTYEIPEGLEVQTAPVSKRIAWAVFGFILQPFRCLV